jgi:hypothetical protein
MLSCIGSGLRLAVLRPKSPVRFIVLRCNLKWEQARRFNQSKKGEEENKKKIA